MNEEQERTQDPAAHAQPPAQDAPAGGVFRRRRASLAPQSPPAANVTPGPEAAQRSTIDAEEAVAAVATHGRTQILPHERESDGSGAADEAAPAPAATKAEAEREQVPPARRAVRLALMLAIVAVAGYVVWSLAETGRTRSGIMRQLARGPRPAPGIDTSKADRLAAELEKRLRRGQDAEVLARARQAVARQPASLALLRVCFKAETVQTVRALGDKLQKLPQPRLQDAAVAVHDNIAALDKRLVYLRALEEQRRDWRRALLAVPTAGKVYARFGVEMVNAPAILANLRTGQTFLQRALTALAGPRPDLDRCAAALRQAWHNLRLPAVARTAADCRRLSRGIYLLDHHVIDQAVEQLRRVDLADALGKERSAATLLARIRARLAAPWQAARRKVGAWDVLNRALAACGKEHARGRTAKALQIIAAALPQADPDNLLTRDLAQKLRARQQHYARLQRDWQRALTAKQHKPLKEQLAAWARFQRLLRDGDGFYRAALRKELLTIKRTIVTRIDRNHRQLRQVGAGYQPITLQMRKPQNPRAPFARAARQLVAMAAVARRITATAALVPGWQLGAKTESRVDRAQSILADLNDQASRLHNLYKLYQRLGKIEVARECLRRVCLLGDSPGNPWYREAVKLLDGK